jgi:cell division septation protein DedD
MPNPTYEDHESQPLHRPGMSNVVNRGSDARDASGNRTSDERPTVSAGKVDPFSVSGDPAPAAPAASTPKPTAPTASSVASSDGAGSGGQAREQVVMDTVDKAVTGP